MNTIGYITSTLVVSAFYAVTKGWAFVILWGWFIVPQFGVKPMTIPMAIGLTMVAQMLQQIKVDKTPDDKRAEEIIKTLFFAICFPTLVVAIAWAVKLFI